MFCASHLNTNLDNYAAFQKEFLWKTPIIYYRILGEIPTPDNPKYIGFFIDVSKIKLNCETYPLHKTLQDMPVEEGLQKIVNEILKFEPNW